MSQVKVKEGESLDNASEDSRDRLPETELSRKCAKESITKSRQLKEKRNLRQLANASINNH